MNGSLIPEVAPPGLIMSNYPAVTQDLNQLSFNISSDQNNQSSRIDLDWSQQLPTAHYAGEWNILQRSCIKDRHLYRPWIHDTQGLPQIGTPPTH
jgi:hypothetical protein